MIVVGCCVDVVYEEDAVAEGREQSEACGGGEEVHLMRQGKGDGLVFVGSIIGKGLEGGWSVYGTYCGVFDEMGLLRVVVWVAGVFGQGEAWSLEREVEER